MDAGNDDVENIRRCKKHENVDYLIKRNLRNESLKEWLEEAQAHGDWESFRADGKEVYTGKTVAGVGRQGASRGVRGDLPDGHARRAKVAVAGHRGGRRGGRA